MKKNKKWTIYISIKILIIKVEIIIKTMKKLLIIRIKKMKSI